MQSTTTTTTRKYILAYKSLIKILKKRIPNLDPCGIPERMEKRDGENKRIYE
jgi:hypothetical protein